MYSNNRNQLRHIFFAAWEKHQQQFPLEPLEKQIIEIILLHPEYHTLLSDPERFQDQDFVADANPFLHLSLHLALREQIQTDRPLGIRKIYQTLCKKRRDTLLVEHRMIECLERILWEAQQNKIPPNERNYLAYLTRLYSNEQEE